MRISDWSSDVCSSDLWAKVIEAYKAKVKEETGAPFPQEPKDQVWAAIGAVFGSWMNQRAITYRRLHSITAEWGTAVNLQAMVFGNKIGRASGRERVCQYVSISVVAVSLKKKHTK